MFKKILVPTDGSPLSDKAIEAALKFAQGAGAKVYGVSVAEPRHALNMSEGSSVIDADDYARQMLGAAQNHVDKLERAARAANVECETLVAQSFNPYEEIIAAAKEYGCDAIFMASHGRKGLSALFVGSETQKVLSHSTIPVLVLR
ncbi:MAG TPA: universal stress protein [Noviherbaspirillum sp.]|uniref:universal stress protein n=1 Tax=Noviherbaspirillum sp. TaxID=1926288 RepID=UPI002D6C35E3|nr:universal stress protein [Noviherbaspirillum sp.]HYD95800.1 universal stress protein [Noviherbaspirillum sp.]